MQESLKSIVIHYHTSRWNGGNISRQTLFIILLLDAFILKIFPISMETEYFIVRCIPGLFLAVGKEIEDDAASDVDSSGNIKHILPLMTCFLEVKQQIT